MLPTFLSAQSVYKMFNLSTFPKKIQIITNLLKPFTTLSPFKVVLSGSLAYNITSMLSQLEKCVGIYSSRMTTY